MSRLLQKIEILCMNCLTRAVKFLSSKHFYYVSFTMPLSASAMTSASTYHWLYHLKRSVVEVTSARNFLSLPVFSRAPSQSMLAMIVFEAGDSGAAPGSGVAEPGDCISDQRQKTQELYSSQSWASSSQRSAEAPPGLLFGLAAVSMRAATASMRWQLRGLAAPLMLWPTSLISARSLASMAADRAAMPAEAALTKSESTSTRNSWSSPTAVMAASQSMEGRAFVARIASLAESSPLDSAEPSPLPENLETSALRSFRAEHRFSVRISIVFQSSSALVVRPARSRDSAMLASSRQNKGADDWCI